MIVFFENLRIEIAGPSIASGGMMMLTRLPSAQAGVDQGLRFVDAAADPRHDLGRDVHHMLIVAEADIGQLELAAPLDIDLLWPVDHDVGDGVVVEQRLERPEAEHVGDQRLDQLALLDKVQLDLGFGQQLLDPAAELGLKGGARHFRRGGHVHMLQNERLDLRLGGLDRDALGVAPGFAGLGIGCGGGRAEQPLDQRGDKVAALERVGLDPVAQQIGLDRRIDNFGELAPAQNTATLRADFRTDPRQQLRACRQEPVLARGGKRRVRRRDRGERGRGGRNAARRQPGDTRVERARRFRGRV